MEEGGADINPKFVKRRLRLETAETGILSVKSVKYCRYYRYFVIWSDDYKSEEALP